MVTIIGYKQRENELGENFYALVIQGGVEMVKSQETNRYYATAKKATISSTFDENTCVSLVGTSLPGTVEKEECEPYEYQDEDSGEVFEFSHRWVYLPEEEPSKPGVSKTSAELTPSMNVFSKNSVMNHA